MPVSAGALAPAVHAVDLSGRPLALGAAWERGPAALFFYKDECPASPLGAVVLPRLAAAVPGLRVLAISQDGAASARAFAAAHGWAAGVEVVLDPEPWPASDAFGVRSTPTWFLVGAGGRVEAVAEGFSRDDANALAARAAALVGAAAPVVSTTADGGPPLRPG